MLARIFRPSFEKSSGFEPVPKSAAMLGLFMRAPLREVEAG
jgi:hypothetical protein